jgi:alpha-galactosidase/6-phospho-beta-glucosidase family protein
MSKNGPKITMIGAGSTVFAKNLIGDILTFPELQNSHIVLFDTNEERLKTSEIVAKKICESLNVKPQITVTTDAERALEGADYAISMIQVGATSLRRLSISRSPRSTACNKPLVTLWVSVESCVACAQFRSCSNIHASWSA